jgi:NAD-dependent deacetylase
MKQLMRQAVGILARSQRLVVFTGAGMSKESGIATFREPEEGLWARHDPHELGTLEGFMRNPELVWKWYEHRFGRIGEVTTHAGHRAIAALERHLPRVVVITQNIDNLHREAGSTDIVELHGNWQFYKCLDGHKGFTHADFADQAEAPPPCPVCGAMLRPDVVWFGEVLPAEAVERALDECTLCDAMLVVGTSGLVQPAASLPYYAHRSGSPIIEVNPSPSALTQLADIFLQGPAGKVLPRVVDELSAIMGSASHPPAS